MLVFRREQRVRIFWLHADRTDSSMKQEIMAEGPRCKRRKQANPRRKHGKKTTHNTLQHTPAHIPTHTGPCPATNSRRTCLSPPGWSLSPACPRLRKVISRDSVEGFEFGGFLFGGSKSRCVWILNRAGRKGGLCEVSEQEKPLFSPRDDLWIRALRPDSPVQLSPIPAGLRVQI